MVREALSLILLVAVQVFGELQTVLEAEEAVEEVRQFQLRLGEVGVVVGSLDLGEEEAENDSYP